MSRFRDRNEPETTGEMRRYVNDKEVKNSKLETIIASHTEGMTDVVTPNFHRRIREGEIINNPMSYAKDTFNVPDGPGDFYAKVGATEYRGSGDGCLTTALGSWLNGLGQAWNVGGLAPVPNPNIDLESASKLTALANVDRSPYAFGEDVFELRETLRFIRDPLHSLRRLSELLKKAYKKEGILSIYDKQKQVKAIAQIWLQYRFAFQPLVRSVHDAVEAFSDRTSLPERRTARGFEEFVGAETLDEALPNYAWTSTTSVVEEHRAGVLYEVTNPFWGWRNKYGLGFKNIPETMWQILPLSFMVDRLVNITKGIQGVVALTDPSVEILAAWHTRKCTTTKTRSCYDYYVANLQALAFKPDTEVDENSTYDRSVWVPDLYDAVPQVEWRELVKDATNVVDLIALIISNTKVR